MNNIDEGILLGMVDRAVKKHTEGKLYDKTRENMKIHIENMLEKGEIFRKIRESVDNIVEGLFEDRIEGMLRDVIRKHFPPNIIYVHEVSEKPPQLSELPVKEFFSAPIFPCIYFLCRDNKIVYIGQSVNLSVRLGEHLKTKGFDRIFYMEVQACDLTETETRLIEYYDPELNKTNTAARKNKRNGKTTKKEII